MAKILYIEDNADNRRLIKRLLLAHGHNVETADDGPSGIDAALAYRPDLILLDINIPQMDGYEVATKLSHMPETMSIPIIALTANVNPGDRERTLAAGCKGYISKPIDIDKLPAQVDEYLQGLHEKIDLVTRTEKLEEHLENAVNRLEIQLHEIQSRNLLLEQHAEKLESTYIQILSSLNTALEAKDPYTAGHSQRVTYWALRIGLDLEVNQEDFRTLEYAGLLHDIGKLIIDLSYIRKKGPLTEEEWKEMSKHPVYSSNIVLPLEFLKLTYEPIRHHHEKYDGSGYPNGLKGDELPLLCWIISCADAMDAMLSRRSYKEPYPYERVKDELLKWSSKQFHPLVAGSAINVIMSEGLTGEFDPAILTAKPIGKLYIPMTTLAIDVTSDIAVTGIIK